MQQKIHTAIAQGEDNLETFSFTTAQFEQLNYSALKNEISINGKNYDIADIRKEKGKITVRCLADEKEMQIKKCANKSQQEKNQQIEKTFSKIFTVQKEVCIIPLTTFTNNPKLFSYYNAFLPKVYLDLISPPPSIV